MKKSLVELGFLLVVFLALASFAHATATPEIDYISAKAGPNSGFNQSTTVGSAITVWGRNLGSSRGSNTLTVAGVTLSSAGDFAEWGSTTSPTTSKDFSRITFYLNSSMTNGNTAGVYVTVGGVQSNTLAFKIDNTCVIRFVDETNGNDLWDGLYKDHTGGGSHGPWKTTFLSTITFSDGTRASRSGPAAGWFIYLRGGTYTNIYMADQGHPTSAYIGYFEESGTPGVNCTVYNPQINGTDLLRITLTSYPGEMAVFTDCAIINKSNYWTFSNIKWLGTSNLVAGSRPANYYSMGDQWAHCTDCWMHSVGLQVIGCEAGGYIHHVIQSFGDAVNLFVNYFSVRPSASSGGFGVDTSYVLYMCSGNGVTVKDNLIAGGSGYIIHNYDESRCSSSYDSGRVLANYIWDSNFIDMTSVDSTPQRGFLVGSETPATTDTVTIINNVFWGDGDTNTYYGAQAETALKFANTSSTVTGASIYNNTFYRFPRGIEIAYSSVVVYTNFLVKNNIFDTISTYEYDGGGTTNITPVWQYNLSDSTLRSAGTISASNNVIGAPSFTNATGKDMSLQTGSPAKDAGVTIASVTTDYNGGTRPYNSVYDIGAFEYGATSGGGGGGTGASSSLSGGTCAGCTIN